jgi:hypothetical protein
MLFSSPSPPLSLLDANREKEQRKRELVDVWVGVRWLM